MIDGAYLYDEIDPAAARAVVGRSLHGCEVGGRGCSWRATLFLPLDGRTDPGGLVHVCRPCIAWVAAHPGRVTPMGVVS